MKFLFWKIKIMKLSNKKGFSASGCLMSQLTHLYVTCQTNTPSSNSSTDLCVGPTVSHSVTTRLVVHTACHSHTLIVISFTHPICKRLCIDLFVAQWPQLALTRQVPGTGDEGKQGSQYALHRHTHVLAGINQPTRKRPCVSLFVTSASANTWGTWHRGRGEDRFTVHCSLSSADDACSEELTLQASTGASSIDTRWDTRHIR